MGFSFIEKVFFTSYFLSRHVGVVRVEHEQRKEGVSVQVYDGQDRLLDRKSAEEVMFLIEKGEISLVSVEGSYLFYLERKEVV